MKTSRITIGVVVVVSFLLIGFEAFADELAVGDAEKMYTCVIDKEIAKCQAKINLKNSRSANLQREAAKSLLKASFLKDYRQELIAEMKLEEMGTRDYQISSFLNQKFLEVYTQILAGAQQQTAPLMAVENNFK